MSYDLTGKVIFIGETKSFGSNGFQVREFAVEVDDGKYSQQIGLQCVQDNCDLLDKVSVGDEATASFDIRGRENNGRYFTNLTVWKLEGGSASNRPPLPSEAPADFDDVDDDIPF